jgi:hypothetical protein
VPRFSTVPLFKASSWTTGTDRHRYIPTVSSFQPSLHSSITFVMDLTNRHPSLVWTYSSPPSSGSRLVLASATASTARTCYPVDGTVAPYSDLRLLLLRPRSFSDCRPPVSRMPSASPAPRPLVSCLPNSSPTQSACSTASQRATAYSVPCSPRRATPVSSACTNGNTADSWRNSAPATVEILSICQRKFAKI